MNQYHKSGTDQGTVNPGIISIKSIKIPCIKPFYLLSNTHGEGGGGGGGGFARATIRKHDSAKQVWREMLRESADKENLSRGTRRAKAQVQFHEMWGFGGSTGGEM